MAHLLPLMTQEPPPEYVAFVERHLDPLRREAERAVGDDPDADGLYSTVLTDVAIRWRWFELLRTRLGRPDPAGRYLPRALTRRSSQRRVETSDHTTIEVWGGDRPDGPPYRRPPVRDSAAVRLADHVRPVRPPEAPPLVEAAIAWWHAYEAHVRRRRIAALVAVLAFLLTILRMQQTVGV